MENNKDVLDNEKKNSRREHKSHQSEQVESPPSSSRHKRNKVQSKAASEYTGCHRDDNVEKVEKSHFSFPKVQREMPPSYPGHSVQFYTQQPAFIGPYQPQQASYIQMQPVQYSGYNQLMGNFPQTVAIQGMMPTTSARLPIQGQIQAMPMHAMPHQYPSPNIQQLQLNQQSGHLLIRPQVSSYMPQGAYNTVNNNPHPSIAQQTSQRNPYYAAHGQQYTTASKNYNALYVSDQDDDCFNIFWLFFLLGPLTWPCAMFGLFSEKKCERAAGAMSLLCLILAAMAVGFIITGA